MHSTPRPRLSTPRTPPLISVIGPGVHADFDTRVQLAAPSGVPANSMLRRLLRAELTKTQALADPLTQVYSRRYPDTVLRLETGRADRSDRSLLVKMIDREITYPASIGESSRPSLATSAKAWVRENIKSQSVLILTCQSRQKSEKVYRNDTPAGFSGVRRVRQSG